MKRAAFFDLDSTLLLTDTGMSWMRFQRRRGEISRLGFARAIYWSLLYKAAVLDMETLANRLVADLAGQPESSMSEPAEIWFRDDVAHRMAPLGRRALDKHRAAGDVIVMLTGSTQYAAVAAAKSLGIEHVLCSNIEVVDGVFTGRFANFCFGQYKVTLAERFAAEHDIDLANSWFYSDSYNDRPMLERVGTAVAVNPDARLARLASRRGWAIEQWA